MLVLTEKKLMALLWINGFNLYI